MQDTPTKIYNPYSRETLTSGDRLVKTSINISYNDNNFISQLADRGCLQAAVGQLIAKLVYELKRSGITRYDPDAFAGAINGSLITIVTGRHGPNNGSDKAPRGLHGTVEASSGNDLGGATAMAFEPDRPAIQPADVCSAPKGVDRRSDSRQGKEGKGKVDGGAAKGTSRVQSRRVRGGGK